MTPEECTIKAEDIKVGFLKTDDFMTTAVVTKEDKVPMAATTTKAADIKVVMTEDGRGYNKQGQYQGRISEDGRMYDKSGRYQGSIQNNN